MTPDSDDRALAQQIHDRIFELAKLLGEANRAGLDVDLKFVKLPDFGLVSAEFKITRTTEIMTFPGPDD